MPTADDDPRTTAASGLGPRESGPLPAPPRRRRRHTAALVGGAVLSAAAVVVAVVVIAHRHDEHAATERAIDRRAAAAEVVRLRRLQTPHRGSARELAPPPGATDAVRLQARADLLTAARASILRDAQGRARSGEIEGPVRGVRCGTIARDPTAVPDDRVLSRTVGRYDCVAVRRPVIAGGGKQVADLGYPFVAALDFRHYTYVWCRNTPPQSERGQALAFVRLDRACLAAKGRAMGTGYADVPGT